MNPNSKYKTNITVFSFLLQYFTTLDLNWVKLSTWYASEKCVAI